MTVMTIKGLEKSYRTKKALRGVDMELRAGGITGLLGPNTSGKTTLLKTIAGLLAPDAGSIGYPGGAVRGPASKATVSFLPDAMKFPAWMKVSDAFGFYRDMYPDYSAEKAERMIKLLDLTPGDKVSSLSKGMQERVALALTFSRAAPVYLLDEPLGGIDPLGKAKILEAILSAPDDNSAILLSTHLVKDVEAVFDSVYFISEGKIIYGGNCDDLREKEGKTVEQKYLEVFWNVKPD